MKTEGVCSEVQIRVLVLLASGVLRSLRILVRIYGFLYEGRPPLSGNRFYPQTQSLRRPRVLSVFHFPTHAYYNRKLWDIFLERISAT